MSSVHAAAAAAAGDTCNTHKSEAQMEIEKTTNKKVNKKKKEILNTPRTIAQLRKQCISSGAGRVLLLSFVGRSDYRLGNMEKNIESQHVIE